MVYGRGNRQLVLSKLLVIALLLVLLMGIGFAPAVAGYREIRDRNVSPFDATDMTVDTGTREQRHAARTRSEIPRVTAAAAATRKSRGLSVIGLARWPGISRRDPDTDDPAAAQRCGTASRAGPSLAAG